MIPGVPELIPVTIPAELTVAIFTLLLLHVPAVVASVSAVESPTHTVAVPVIADGSGATVSVLVA